MIQKFLYLLAIPLCLGILFSGCKDDKDEIYIVDDQWQADNEKIFAEIAKNSEYTEIKSMSNAGSIYYKELEPKSPVTPTDENIYYTSRVKVYFFGISMDETSRKMEYQFSSSDYPFAEPATINVNGEVDGFATALQYMKPGDRWEVWIPWKLGYGETGKRALGTGQSIRPWPYSTLKYEVEVVEIVE